eukprot:95039-Lingulodinium_polyedra.AAC.1
MPKMRGSVLQAPVPKQQLLAKMRGSAPMAPVPKRQALAKMRGSVLQVPMAAPPTPPWRRASPQHWSPPRSPPQ